MVDRLDRMSKLEKYHGNIYTGNSKYTLRVHEDDRLGLHLHYCGLRIQKQILEQHVPNFYSVMSYSIHHWYRRTWLALVRDRANRYRFDSAPTDTPRWLTDNWLMQELTGCKRCFDQLCALCRRKPVSTCRLRPAVTISEKWMASYRLMIHLNQGVPTGIEAKI